ncbi:hypothetical protein C2R22_03880 [Salinigranum rubrum]|uniref:DUF7344 domain-containing protein n=1 Tax=Salinigranum rubrum TaxID=755307 RepID=A0A2I8VG57_9EURY|nr:hypothetical protein [Salinigranum rubrum]AUV80901.1 hypothetical protein C2R22_03880 [Salinigranum rubrum]
MNSLDELFQLLSQERRRFALYYLDQADGPVALEELAREVARRENGSPGPASSDDYAEQLITLKHNHLPRIADATHIEYDRDNRFIRITGMTPEADLLLSVSKKLDKVPGTPDISSMPWGSDETEKADR